MSSGIWAPFKELASVVNEAILQKQPDAFYRLEAILKKHKPDFISLLKNPAKNPSHRAQVTKAVKDGLQIPSLPSVHTLPQDFIDEALILSDILDLNEISSVELLLAGEQQLPRFPTLTRGLVAVLLYYDGRCSMVTSLRTLIQAREGITWSLGLNQATTNLVTSFTDDLFADGLVKKILTLIDSISEKDELERLAKGRAIGKPKHRHQIIDYIKEQRSCLAECLLHWACQNPFPKDETLQLFDHLRKVELKKGTDGGQSGSGGEKQGQGGGKEKEAARLDAVNLTLFHTLLACFNIGEFTAESAVDVSLIDEDRYPLVTDPTFVPKVHEEILKGPAQWASARLFAAVEFAWGVLLRECAGRAVFTESGVTEVEDDEGLVDDAIKTGAIHFLRQSVVASEQFHQEELCVQRTHSLVTSFIVNMPLKVNELRNQGDEVAKEMVVLEGDYGRRGFEEFMKLIGDLYSSDPNNLQLALEYWAPVSDHTHQQQHGMGGALGYRTPQRQLSLYKFVTSCSDLLPAQLFSPFMHMLIGLSSSPLSAHCCFNFLKANSPSLGGGGASAAISLDHFFHSLKQYYYSLSRDSAHKATPTGCAITPQELDGLKKVLSIIQAIATHDDAARIVMYENQSWLPVASLFGLVGCSVPGDLKAEILRTLATFALSPEIASNMWVTLEVSQVLNTVYSPLTGIDGDSAHHSAHHSFALREGSIQVELEEIESQTEEYPLTRAFLKLLSALLEVSPPPTLGAGHRIPGFEPYLAFVRDAVFLKYDCRAYRNEEEKWEVAHLSLEVLHKLLSSYEFTEADFVDTTYQLPNREAAVVPKPPGISILTHLMNTSQLLRKVLSVLDEACQRLSDPSQRPSDSVALSALLSLKLLENALSREQEFLDLLRRYNTKSVLASPLHQLLLGINPRTGRADHMVTIAKYVCIGKNLPELSLLAVRTLYWVTQSHKVGRDVVTAIVSDKDACAEIICGFVDHLETDFDGQEPSRDDSLDTVAKVNRGVQLAILKLIASCINKSAPNIAHLLLGFDVATGKPIAQMILQDPGILGSPRTCLHSILSLIDHGEDTANPSGCHYSNAKVAEFCYKVLYLMCSSRDLSTPTLRYLRNNHEYFYSQLVHLPLNPDLLPGDEGGEEEEGGAEAVDMETTSDFKCLSLMHQQAWVLKSVAVELRMTSLSHQWSHTQRIVNLLLSGPGSDVTDATSSGEGVGVALGGARLKSDFDFLQEGRRKVLILLDQVNFADKEPPSLEPLEFPHLAAIEQVVRSCEAKDPISEQVYIDEKQLLKLLNNTEISPSDVQRLMSYVAARNHVNGRAFANYELFESWRQLIEVMLHSLVHSDMKKGLKVAVLFELIQDLLLKIAHVEPSQLTTSVQGVILILLSHLRLTVNSADPEQDDSALSSLYSGPLHGIMRGLMDNVLKVPAAMQQAKAYLYGSLLYYLTMTKQEGGGANRGLSLWQPDSEQNNIASGNLSTLNSFGETFMDAVCKNACSGHDVARMLSLSLLDSIISLDWQGTWLRFMSQRGFLQTLSASVQWEDESLQKMLLPSPEALKALYIYESKMALLTRVASSPVGARDIVSLNAINYLTQCKFIRMRPSYYGDSYHGAGGGDMSMGFIPSSFDRYRQLFLPLLKFLVALLTCPGPHHKEACVQVASFIAEHSEVFAAVLKEPLHSSVVSMATLQELSLVTAVVSHSGVGQDLSSDSSQAMSAPSAALHRLQRLMMSLLPHFWSKQNWRTLAQRAVQVEDSEGGVGVTAAGGPSVDEAFLLVQQVTANIVSYCQVAMTMGGTELSSPYCRILLTPDLSEALSRPKPKDQFLGRELSGGASAPSLGLLIQHIKECTEGYFTALEAHQQHSKKLESRGKLSSDEMRQLLDGMIGNEKLLPSQQQSLARKKLQQLITNRKSEMQLYSYIIENMLYILWRHLQYYLVHCKPVDPDISLGVPGIDRSTGLRRLQDQSTSFGGTTAFEVSSLGDGVRSTDLDDLKASAVKCLTDGFFKKLLDLEEAHLQAKAEMRIGFVQALVRRIRRLLKLRAAAF